MTASVLQDILIAYLQSRGWYFDEERARQFTWVAKADRVREVTAWTLPQWGEYWSSDHLPPEGKKPKERRYECLKDAIWSQLLREEKPETYAVFFKERDA
jgi:hypothetical protein